MNTIKYSFFVLCVSGIAGCVTKDFTDKEVNAPLQEVQQTKVRHNNSYIKIHSIREQYEDQKINLVGRISLIDAFRRFLPQYHLVPMDVAVKLETVINVNAIDMPVDQFITYLASLSGYSIKKSETAKNDSLEIRSFVTQEWMLGALSGGKKIALSSNASLNKGLDDESESAALSEKVSFDEWDNLIESSREILSLGEHSTKGLKSYVYGARSVGKVTAGGSVAAMARLDEYLSSLAKSSTQQIAIEVQAFDVMLSDDRGSGVNWQEFAALGASLNGNALSAGIANSSNTAGFLVPNALANEGLWRGQLGYRSSSFSGQAVLQFLSRFGEVELLNQPNLTVRNGGFAVMHAGEQLSYIADTEVVRESDDDTVAVAASVKQLKVGVSLAVSPKLLDDKRILLNIWPVVSSVQGFDEFYSEPIPVRVPRLALQELSTEVIVESGKTIQLGGLIRKSMVESLQSVPFRDGVSGALLKPLFHADSKVLERRELVILVSPRIISAGQ